ncbi:uncharacterized protein LOC107270067 isoform X2 [Cephus cinctus]|uniref:Uncharacterized protein LOC107270067 isoform X2 n=1 Tax=Cephus cinctus TaxID=211228 RepID=A0AAJ7RLR6_CEPCN|nr:uncharacterized protein LOC107270067 isoform X2 [Cephus cinctus]
MEVKTGTDSDQSSMNKSDMIKMCYSLLLEQQKEDIKIDSYGDLIIATPHSKCYLMDTAKRIVQEEIVKISQDTLADGRKGFEKDVIQERKTDFTMRWKTRKSPYFYNDYNTLLEIPKLMRSPQNLVLMNNLFFSCFCEKYYDGTRRLILHGNDLLLRIRRRFEDWDMPYLLIFLRSNRDVVSLSLPYNRIHSAGFMNLIDHISAYNDILELNLQNNFLEKPGIEYMCSVGEKLQLRILQLNGNKFGVDAAKEVALLLLKNPYIRYLDVAEVDQTISSLVYFTTVMRNDQNQYNDTLKILDISRPNSEFKYYFDTEHFATVLGELLRFNKCLVELHVQKYGFSCHDIEIMLIDAQHNNTLHLLDLSRNNIGDHGMEKIADWLKTRPALQGLLLAHNIITSTGARALSFCMPFSRIRLLDISHNQISDEGGVDLLNTIKKSTPIRHLRLFGNNLGHLTAQIVERMLMSGVLTQDNLDIIPYRIDGRLNLAFYPADHYKQRYYNVPVYGYPQPLRLPYICNAFKGKAMPKIRFKYFDPVPIERRRPRIHPEDPYACICCKCKDDQAMNSLAPSNSDINSELCICGVCQYEEHRKEPSICYSDITMLSKSSYSRHSDDCTCCYCEVCEGKSERDSEVVNNHIAHCTCCECTKVQCDTLASSSSSTSSKPDKVQHLYESKALHKIALILDHVDSEMRNHILRWVTIDEVTLEEDLKAGHDESNSEQSVDQEPICTCWIPITVPIQIPCCIDETT